MSSWGERNNKKKASTFHGAWFRLWIVGRDLNGLVLPINWNSFWTYRESRLEKVGIFGTSLPFPPPLPSNLFPLALQTYLQNFISNSKRILSCDPIGNSRISFSSTLLFFFLKSHYGHRVPMGTELALGIARKGCWRCNTGQRHPLWMGNAIISPSELERGETDICHSRWDGRPGTLMGDALPSRWKQPRGSRKLSEGSWYF